MYASTWICTKYSADPTVVVEELENYKYGSSEVVEDLEL